MNQTSSHLSLSKLRAAVGLGLPFALLLAASPLSAQQAPAPVPAAVTAPPPGNAAPATPASGPGDATAPVSVATETVTGVTGPDTSPTADVAAAALAEVPGTVSVVPLEEVQRGRASNAQDVLSYQPGVFAQATSGNTANKISIRGSGLNTFYQGYILGTKILYDGLSITGPGATQEDLLDLFAVNYTEVLYGDNAFTYASTSLGGAINFVTNDGYTAPGYYGRFELGSYGYNKEELSFGAVQGNNDIYVAVGHDEREGFQHTTPNSGEDAVANFGHRFNPRLETRLIVRYRRDKLVEGGALKLAQINADPTLNLIPAGRREDGTTLVESKTTLKLDDGSKLELGLDFHNYPLWNGWEYSTTPQAWTSVDLSAILRYEREDQIFNKIPSKTQVIFSDTRLVNGFVNGYNGIDGTKQTLRQYTQYSGSQDAVFAIGNELAFADNKLFLSTGLSEIGIDRDVRIEKTTLANPTTFPKKVDYDDWYTAPRAGLRYEITPNVQVFGNVSAAVDGPVTWQMGSTSVGYVRPLSPQTATTAEVGVRGTWGIFDGSLTLYHSWVRDELLTVIVIPATTTSDAVTANSNATKTTHQGIEAALTTNLWRGGNGDKLFFRQAFTANDFYYDNDPLFHGNALPGLPTRVYQAELNYEQARGFYVGVNVRAASSYYVDYANTLQAPGYAILGSELGYETPHWKVFLDLKNLTNKHYVSATNTAYNLGGVDSANFFPGDGFNVVAGFSFKY
jgi:iron complex outermembrane receptor protein